MSYSKLASVLCSTLLIMTTSTLAEQTPGFTANAALDISHDSNIRRLVNELEQSDTIVTLRPNLDWLALFGKHQVDLHYKGDYALYKDEDDLSYTDHALVAHGLFDHSYRLSTDIELGLMRDHDDPGSTNALGTVRKEFNQYDREYIKGKVLYGTSSSTGQLILGLAHNDRSYTNNNQSFRDYKTDQITGTFFYRTSPRTRVLLEAALTDYDYTENDRGFDQSSKDIRYLLGVEWEATAKTTGIFKIGHQDKQYDDDIFGDLSGLTLSLDMVWSINTYTELKIGASRDTNESAQRLVGGYVSEYLRAEFKHAFTARTTVKAKASYGDEEYSNNNNRNDKRSDLSIGLEHELRRWLNIGIEYRYEERDSNENIFDYDASIFMLTLSTTFD